MLRYIIEYNPPVGHGNASQINDLQKQIKLIIEWAEMRLYFESYTYVKNNIPILYMRPTFLDQAEKLINQFKKDKEMFGSLHPHLKALSLSTPDHDLSNFSDVTMACYFYKVKTTPTWNQFT